MRERLYARHFTWIGYFILQKVGYRLCRHALRVGVTLGDRHHWHVSACYMHHNLSYSEYLLIQYTQPAGLADQEGRAEIPRS